MLQIEFRMMNFIAIITAQMIMRYVNHPNSIIACQYCLVCISIVGSGLHGYNDANANEYSYNYRVYTM